MTKPGKQYQRPERDMDVTPADLPGEPDKPSLPAFRSLAFEDIPAPDYADVIIRPVPPQALTAPTDPKAWAEAIFSSNSMPPWVVALMQFRQAVVGLAGISRASPETFDVIRVSGEEALLSANESHLDFRCGVAFDAETRLLRVTTVVRLKGWRGRLYFLPVRLLHPIVVNAMIARTIRTVTDPARVRTS